jgi:hypothetical protein
MAAFGESCRGSGHVLTARFDPSETFVQVKGCRLNRLQLPRLFQRRIDWAARIDIV